MRRSKTVAEAAERLESLLPQAMSTLFPHSEEEPLAQVPVGQLRLLRHLSQGPQTVTDIAERMHLSTSALTQMAARLVAHGLVVKCDDCDDRRVRWLSLSDEGRRLVECRARCRAASAASVLERLDRERVCQLLDLLQEVVALRPAHGADAETDYTFI